MAGLDNSSPKENYLARLGVCAVARELCGTPYCIILNVRPEGRHSGCVIAHKVGHNSEIDVAHHFPRCGPATLPGV